MLATEATALQSTYLHLLCGSNEWAPTQHCLHSPAGKFLQPITHHWWPQLRGLQGTGRRLGEYLCISAVLSSIISSLLTVLWLLPPPSTSCTHVLGHPRPCPGKHWGHPECGDHLQCPGLGPAGNEAGASCSSPTRMTQCEAWGLLL